MLFDLSKTPIASILRQLATERRSGDLQVRTQQIVKLVFFDRGRIVFAASNLKRDRLGEFLVALGTITPQDFERAMVLMHERSQRIGEALVLAGAIEKTALGKTIARQVKRIVLSLFPLTDGVATFEERPCTIPLEYMVGLSIHRVLYDGIRMMTSEPLVMAGLKGLDRRVQTVEVPPFPFDPATCPEEEETILKRSLSRVTIRRLAWQEDAASGSRLDFNRLRSTYALLTSGLLRDSDDAAGEPEPSLQTETGSFLLSALQDQPEADFQESVREEVKQQLERSAALDQKQWLDLTRETPKDVVIKALEAKISHYSSLLGSVGEDADLRTDIELILGRSASLLRVTRQQQRAPRPAAEPQPAPAPESQAEPAPAPAPQAEPAPAPAPAPEAASQPPGGEGLGVLPIESQLRYLIMEADLSMTVQDFGNAIKVWSKIVHLAPEVAEYHLRLATVMALFPRAAKNAEREYVQAIRLDPDNAEYHYQFGLYYKIVKQRSRAVIEFRAALQVNRHHVGAREELEQMAPKDSILTGLKRLFS